MTTLKIKTHGANYQRQFSGTADALRASRRILARLGVCQAVVSITQTSAL